MVEPTLHGVKFSPPKLMLQIQGTFWLLTRLLENRMSKARYLAKALKSTTLRKSCCPKIPWCTST